MMQSLFLLLLSISTITALIITMYSIKRCPLIKHIAFIPLLYLTGLLLDFSSFNLYNRFNLTISKSSISDRESIPISTADSFSIPQIHQATNRSKWTRSSAEAMPDKLQSTIQDRCRERSVYPNRYMHRYLLENSQVLSVQEHESKDRQLRYRTKLLKVNFKYPYILLEETFANTIDGKNRPALAYKAAVADHILVKLEPNIDTTELEHLGKRLNADFVRKLDNSGVYIVEFSDFDINTVESTIALASTNEPHVLYAEPDYLVQILNVPDDPRIDDQWSVTGIGWTDATYAADLNIIAGWDIETGNRNTTVAVLDTGVDYSHQDLAGNIWMNPGEVGVDSQGNDKTRNGIDDDENGLVDDVYGWDFYNDDNVPTDDNRHGTHVAGIIGAVGNNQTGITGVCWNTSLVPVKFLSSGGIGATSDAIEAIHYCIAIGVDIINNSWGGSDYSYALNDALESANRAECTIVAAAGNDGQNINEQSIYPASYDLPNIITVAATDESDTLAWFSNYGSKVVDLTAPGVRILSTFPNNTYGYLEGTSMAAPHVSGTFALLRSRYPDMETPELISRLLASTDTRSSLEDKCSSGGRLNVYRALDGDPVANFNFQVDYGVTPAVVTFSNSSVGPVNSLLWDFGDGTTISTTDNPTHIYEEYGVYDVTLTIEGNFGTKHKTRTISIVPNYDVVEIPFAWTDTLDMTELTGLGNNGVSSKVDLSFEFQFYGQTYTSVFIGSNGLLGFSPEGLDDAGNRSLPHVGISSPVLFPYWDDLNPAAGGRVYAGTTGNYPNRKLIVTWEEVPYFFNPSPPFSFQVVLNETSNSIEFHYLEVHPENVSFGSGRSATVGIQSTNAILSAMYSYNERDRVTNSTAILFTPAHHTESSSVQSRNGTYEVHDLEFYPEWNLISTPIQLIRDKVSELAEGLEIGDFNYWDNQSEQYQTATEINPNLGYWVYSYAETNIECLGKRPEDEGVNLSRGWNLIGVTDSIQLADYSTSIASVWGWNPKDQNYSMVYSEDSLAPGHGYWVYAINEFTLKAANRGTNIE